VVRPEDGVEWLASPTDTSVTRSDAGWTLEARLRPDILAGGRRLDQGLWRVVVVHGDGARYERRPVRVRRAIREASVSDEGLVTVVASRQDRLLLDVGATAHPIVSGLSPEETSITEDARGTLLTARLPRVDLLPGVELNGSLRIGRLPVPAVIRADPSGQPVLNAWLSTLAGEYALETQFTSFRYAGTGLRLATDGSGAMRAVRAAAEPSPGTSPTPSARQSALGRAGIAARRVGRRVPGARTAYRRLRGSR
jgi:hypothetical protein